jgi:hypothetical protein
MPGRSQRAAPVDAGRVMTAATATHTCPHCGMTTAHPQDVQNRYCGRCHHFCDDSATAADRIADVLRAARLVRELVGRNEPVDGVKFHTAIDGLCATVAHLDGGAS